MFFPKLRCKKLHQCDPIHLTYLLHNCLVVLTSAEMAPPYVALLFLKLHRVASNTDSSCTIKTCSWSNGMCHSKKHTFANYPHVHCGQSLWKHISEPPHMTYIESLSLVKLILVWISHRKCVWGWGHVDAIKEKASSHRAYAAVFQTWVMDKHCPKDPC